MAEILINKITGSMAEIPRDGNLGIKGNELLVNSNCTVKSVTGELAEQIRRKHCRYIDGNIVLLPEEEWLENIPDPEPEEAE